MTRGGFFIKIDYNVKALERMFSEKEMFISDLYLEIKYHGNLNRIILKLQYKFVTLLLCGKIKKCRLTFLYFCHRWNRFLTG